MHLRWSIRCFGICMSCVFLSAMEAYAASPEAIPGRPSFSFWKMCGVFLLGLFIFPAMEFAYNFALGYTFSSKPKSNAIRYFVYFCVIGLIVAPDSPWGGGLFSWHVAHTVAFLVGAGIAAVTLTGSRWRKRKADH